MKGQKKLKCFAASHHVEILFQTLEHLIELVYQEMSAAAKLVYFGDLHAQIRVHIA